MVSMGLDVVVLAVSCFVLAIDGTASCENKLVESFNRGVGGWLFDLGKLPSPFVSHNMSISSYLSIVLSTNSKLGLFLPERMCEILDLGILMLSANAAALML